MGRGMAGFIPPILKDFWRFYVSPPWRFALKGGIMGGERTFGPKLWGGISPPFPPSRGWKNNTDVHHSKSNAFHLIIHSGRSSQNLSVSN